MLRAPLVFVAAVIASGSAPATAADTPFPPPALWKETPTAAAPDTSRKVMQWHVPGDISTLTVIEDASGDYASALAAIEKNFADNKIKPATDAQLKCQGKDAHIVEFATGPDGHRVVINRMIVPQSPAGLITVTYARGEGSTFDDAVKKSETDFCAATP